MRYIGLYFVASSAPGVTPRPNGPFVTVVSVPDDALIVNAAMLLEPWFETYRNALVASTVRATGWDGVMTPEPAVAKGDPETGVSAPEVILYAETSLEPLLAEYRNDEVESSATATGCVPAAKGEPATGVRAPEP